MSIRADQTYNGTVTGGSWTRSANGNLGFQIALTCPDGDAGFTIWLTKNTKDMAKRNFQVLGLSEAQMRDKAFLNYQLPTHIHGREISFTTFNDEYQGKTRVKVKSIGFPVKSVDEAPAEAASFFGAGTNGGQETGEFQATDDDVPF